MCVYTHPHKQISVKLYQAGPRDCAVVNETIEQLKLELLPRCTCVKCQQFGNGDGDGDDGSVESQDTKATAEVTTEAPTRAPTKATIQKAQTKTAKTVSKEQISPTIDVSQDPDVLAMQGILADFKNIKAIVVVLKRFGNPEIYKSFFCLIKIYRSFLLHRYGQ